LFSTSSFTPIKLFPAKGLIFSCLGESSKKDAFALQVIGAVWRLEFRFKVLGIVSHF
jgi:hypothetical protein